MDDGGGDGGAHGNHGFSEEALRALDARLACAPPPEAYEQALDPRTSVPSRGRDSPARSETGQRPHYWGHRARFRQGGGTALPDYELLEMILFNAIPRIDVKPLAKTLIDRFGSFDNAINASETQLLQVAGVDPKVCHQFRLMQATAQRLTRSRIVDRPMITSWSQMTDYLQVLLANRETEEFWVLFLDRKNILIQDENLGRGSIDHVPVYPRQIVKRALELNASALILIHNHPSGDPTPSSEDIAMTHKIAKACQIIGATIHDHVIVGKGQYRSLKQLGLF